MRQVLQSATIITKCERTNPQGVASLKKAIYCSSLSQLDDVGAGKLREMLALHSNRHAVHGRFTLKDDCERQVWNAVAAS